MTVREDIIQAAWKAVEAAAELIGKKGDRKPRLRRSDTFKAGGPGGGSFPELIVIPGPDIEIGRDGLGQAYHFEIHVKIWTPQGPVATRDDRTEFAFDTEAVCLIAALEAENAFGANGKLVRGAEFQSFVRNGLSVHPGPFVVVLVEYARLRGKPQESYVPAGAMAPPTTSSEPQPAFY